MEQFSQSIHLNPATEKGQEILSVLLAVPRYQRGDLIRTILFGHIRDTAMRLWPGMQSKTPEDIKDTLAGRPAKRSRRPVRSASEPTSTWAQEASVELSEVPPNDVDIEARLDTLVFK